MPSRSTRLLNSAKRILVRLATIEFWQGGTNRLHDRFQYARQADDSWVIERLAP